MFKFRNENVKKEASKKTRNLAIWIVIILIAIGLLFYCFAKDEEESANRTNINNIILKEDNEDKKVEVKVACIPYVFATSSETEDKYYLITDGEFLYIVCLTDEQFEELNKEDIDKNPVTIQGVSKKISNSIMQYALETYNEPLSDERKIAKEDAEGYFGDIYLDSTVDFTEANNVYFSLGLILGMVGLIGFVISLVVKIRFKTSVNKMSEEDASVLDDEMNNPSAFYYSKTHMYLTENYIINFSNKFQAISYKDIVWMYEYVQRVNFVKTSKSIIIMTKDGKKHTIATINLITKAKKEIFDEIWKTISSKNPEIKMGFTQENIKEMKETYGRRKNKKELL